MSINVVKYKEIYYQQNRHSETFVDISANLKTFGDIQREKNKFLVLAMPLCSFFYKIAAARLSRMQEQDPDSGSLLMLVSPFALKVPVERKEFQSRTRSRFPYQD